MDLPGIIDQVIREINRLHKTINANQSTRIRARDEQELIKANAFSWFKGYRTQLESLAGSEALKLIDDDFQQLLEYSDRQTSRLQYKSTLKSIKSALVRLRSESLKSYAVTRMDGDNAHVAVPNFSSLVFDRKMQRVLENRWNEIVKCLGCNAPLAATIMMGGLLEALFLARANKLEDKALLFTAKAAPIDRSTKKVVPLDKWMLNSFIEVAAELGWIRKPARDIGIVLRDYRNFIHPERELSTGFTLEKEDAQMFWQIFSQISKQIIVTAGK